MKKITLLLLLCCYISFAQKTAPVAGHAAQLVDLLKKDYGASDIVSRNETVLKDMEDAIAIFKIYIDKDFSAIKPVGTTLSINRADGNAIPFNAVDVPGKRDTYETDLNSYNTLTKTLGTISVTSEDTVGSAFQQLQVLNTSMLGAKKLYEEEKFKSNTNELLLLRHYFENENKYLHYMAGIFILKYDVVNRDANDAYAEANYSSAIQKGLPFFGGDLAFKDAIDGLSRFLAQRIKDELTTYAIQKVQDYLNNPKPESYLNELMVLLPTTTAYLKSFDASRTLNFVDDLKQYIEDDLNNLIENAAGLRHTPRFKKYIDKHPDLDFAFEALELLPQISKLENPIDYFDMLENSRNIQRWSSDPSQTMRYNIANSIKFSSLLAHSLMVVEDRKPKFASAAFMSGYSSEVNFYLLYIGFLHQQNKIHYDITFMVKSSEKKLEDGLKIFMDSILAPESADQAKKEFKIISGSLTRIATNAEKLNNSLTAIKKTNNAGEKVTMEQVHALAGDMIDFSENVLFTVDTLMTDPNLKLFRVDIAEMEPLAKQTSPYFTTARTVNDIFLDLHTKNFTTAIVKAIEIPSAFRKDNDEFALYNSVFTVTDNLNSVQEFYNLKKLFSYKRLYNDKEKRENQKELANWIKISLEADPGLGAYSSGFDTVHSLIKGEHNRDGSDIEYDFTQELDVLAAKLKDSVFYRKYAGINIGQIKGRIKKLFGDRGVNPTVSSKIADDVESIMMNAIAEYVFNDEKAREELEEDKKLLIQNLKYHLPEMFPDIFRFKDENTVKLIHFVNDIANAGTAEDVEKALNTFALPPGSSSLKEKASGYYSLNSYPGLFGGYAITAVDNSYSLGFTAPVGIYAQLGHIAKGTLGLYMPIIDIGAPVRLRLGSDTEEMPDLEFKDIFSPGIFLSYGFPKSPFAINVGIQYGPRLTEFTEEGGDETTPKQPFFIGAGLVIDIPLFTLHAKSRD